MSTAVAMAYAGDLFVLCTIERRWRRGEALRIVSKLALLVGLSADSVALQLFVGAVRAPQLHDLPPAVALETQLRLLLALAPVTEVSLWTKAQDGRPVCLIEDGSTTQTRRFRAVAALALLWSKRKDFLTFRERPSPELGLAFVLIAVVSGHAVAGEFGWFCRYEIYAVIVTLTTSIFLARNPIRGVLARPGGHLTVLLGGAALLITVGSRYIVATTQVPIAANNTYEQQYQMHRFLTEFHVGPAAVNDLGWTSYRNSNYVLDLTGLGFDQARVLRRNHAGADAFDRLVKMKGVDLAIVYTDWFKGQIPSNWTLLARMSLSRRRITAAEEVVDFYATDAIYVDQIREELRDFSRALPARIRLEMVEKAASINSR